MSGLNIRQFAKVEPTNGEDTIGNQPDRSQRQQEANEPDSDDSDAGIQYLAPDQTPCGKWVIDELRFRNDERELHSFNSPCQKRQPIIFPSFTDPGSLIFPIPHPLMVPKVERGFTSNAFINDSISADQGIVVKSESSNDAGNISSQVLNEIRPVHQSDIPGYERDAVQERQLAALG